MKNRSTYLVAVGLIASFALIAALPASAKSKRHHWRYQWSDQARHERQQLSRGRVRPKVFIGEERRLLFGVGPNSYECYGYDCNW